MLKIKINSLKIVYVMNFLKDSPFQSFKNP